MLNDPFSSGHRAFLTGAVLSDNPYPKNNIFYTDWANGWSCAYLSHLGDPEDDSMSINIDPIDRVLMLSMCACLFGLLWIYIWTGIIMVLVAFAASWIVFYYTIYSFEWTDNDYKATH